MRLSGANANNGTNAGAFATNTNNAASNSNANVSAPLYFAVRKRLDGVKDLATWQKMTNAQKDAGRPVTVRTLPSNGTNAGAFATNTNNAASNSNANVSAPLYFAVRKRLDGVKDLATWQKMTNAQKDAGRPVTVRTLPSKAKQTLRHSDTQNRRNRP